MNGEMSLVAVLLASLLGSLHCAGMCGGIVAYFSGKSEKPVQSHTAYHFGRLLTYSALGALAGFVGLSLDKAGQLAGIQRVTLIATGALLIYWGVKEFLGKGSILHGSPAGSFIFSRLSSVFGRLFDAGENQNWVVRSFVIGLLSTFLPCGWLYTFTAMAAASGSPQRGALVMAFFWLGTVPVLVGVGGAAKALTMKTRSYLPKATACLLIAAGLFSLSGPFKVLFLEKAPSMNQEQSTHHCH